MIRDQQTGLPLIGARDTRPVKLRVIHKDMHAVVIDQETGRPIGGIMEISYVLNQHGVQLVLMFAPDSYELAIEEKGTAVRPPAQLLSVKNGSPADLRDGEQIVVTNPDGSARAVLTVTLLPQPESPAAAATPAS